MSKTSKYLENAMTVEELREMLESYDDDMPVVFAFSSGDYWHSDVAENVTEVEELEVTYSDYHRKFKLVEDMSDDDNGIELVLVLQ